MSEPRVEAKIPAAVNGSEPIDKAHLDEHGADEESGSDDNQTLTSTTNGGQGLSYYYLYASLIPEHAKLKRRRRVCSFPSLCFV